jgi:hypothetical protein
MAALTEIMRYKKKSKNLSSFPLTGSVVLNLLRVGNQIFLNENIYLFAHISAPLAALSIPLPGGAEQHTPPPPSTILLSPEFIENPSLLEKK